MSAGISHYGWHHALPGTLDCRAGDRAEEQQAFIPLCFLTGCEGTAASSSGHLDCSTMMGCTREPRVRTGPFFWKLLSSGYFHSNMKRRQDFTVHPAQTVPRLTFLMSRSPEHTHAPPHSSLPQVCNERANLPPIKQVGKWFSST